MSLSDEMLIAYADGELPQAERAKVEAAIAADPALAERLERHRALRRRLSGAFVGVLDEPVPERLVEAARPSTVVSFPPPRRGAVPAWAAIAAALVVGVFAGLSVPRFGPQPVIGADMTARGELAEALETQLASTQTADAPVRIGLTFAGAQGYCRTFALKDLAGLACRGGDDWRVRLVEASSAAGGDYRMAASTVPPSVLEAAEALIVGAPLDAEAEAAARDAGWDK